MTVRHWFYAISAFAFTAVGGIALVWPPILWLLIVLVPPFLLGLYDVNQKRHTVLRNFPVIGHGRYMMEAVRPEIQQYFIENDLDAFPIEREKRSVVYQRAKAELETKPFGTNRDVYRVGYEWAAHSVAPREPLHEEPRVTIGTGDAAYTASLFNISAMSYGSISPNAVLALNKGAKIGGFAHNTGEGGLSSYHLEHGGDLIWQIGTGYFGCRTRDGNFDKDAFRDKAAADSVRLIEIKLSQGAKPGAGGILPGVKVTEEIARFRGVEVGEPCISPPAHSAFSTPIELMQFVEQLRDLSGGKPVGLKLCVGRRSDFFAILKAMLETDITPDFVTVDGGEGGTGAAPLEFSNSLGMPARDAWIFVSAALAGVNLRERVRVIASGKILTGFDIVRALALGADLCNSARGMMLALGCIQSLRCNTNRCPTGVTTLDPALMYGLDVTDKSARVASYHAATIRGCLHLAAAMGLEHPADVRPHHLFRRVDDLLVRNMSELYDFLEPGQLLDDRGVPEGYRREWRESRPDAWTLAPEEGQYGGEALREH